MHCQDATVLLQNSFLFGNIHDGRGASLAGRGFPLQRTFFFWRPRTPALPAHLVFPERLVGCRFPACRPTICVVGVRSTCQNSASMASTNYFLGQMAAPNCDLRCTLGRRKSSTRVARGVILVSTDGLPDVMACFLYHSHPTSMGLVEGG